MLLHACSSFTFVISLYLLVIMQQVIFSQWIPEVVKHCPKRPFFLVGTQIHLRSDEATIGELWKCNQVPVSQIAAEQAANELRAMKYIECSDWTLEGLTEVFDEFILQSLTRPKAPSKWSSFLHPKVAFPILRSAYMHYICLVLYSLLTICVTFRQKQD